MKLMIEKEVGKKEEKKRGRRIKERKEGRE